MNLDLPEIETLRNQLRKSQARVTILTAALVAAQHWLLAKEPYGPLKETLRIMDKALEESK